MPPTDRSDRLQRARLAAGFSRQRDALEQHADWNRNTYKSNENGAAPFSFDQAKVYGQAFGVRAEWLYDGAGPMEAKAVVPRAAPQRRADAEPRRAVMPLISWVSAGRLADVPQPLMEKDARKYDCSDLPPGDYFALKVRGDSMDRVSPEGSIIIVNRADATLVSGRAYVFSVGGEVTYKRWRPRPPRLEPYSTNPMNEPIFIDRSDKSKELVVLGRVCRTVLDL